MNWIEITTLIGCPNKCYYCPQQKLLSKYKSDKKSMTIDDFKFYLNKINKDNTQIHFNGFSESFYNPDTFKMIKYASEQGYKIVIYTTLEGNINYKELKGVHLEELHIHNYPTGNIKQTQKRLKKLLQYITVDVLTDDIIKDPISRAGHNWTVTRKKGQLTCDRFNCNVLLPNGEVYLCCQDYGLEHKIGDLKIDSYDSIQFNIIRRKIQIKALNENEETLCRYCEHARGI